MLVCFTVFHFLATSTSSLVSTVLRSPLAANVVTHLVKGTMAAAGYVDNGVELKDRGAAGLSEQVGLRPLCFSGALLGDGLVGRFAKVCCCSSAMVVLGLD